MQKFFGVVLIVFLVFYVVTRPQAAAGQAQAIGSGIHSLADGFANFFASLGGK
jgi:hypothetical protein